MTLKQLEYFLAIAETESITRAAENLHVSQPPLSLQLKALEDELGVTLFRRDRKVLTITPEGILLRRRATEVFELLNQTVQELQGEGGRARVSIRVGTINSVSNRLLPPTIYDFCSKLPNVDVQVSENSSTEVLRLLDAHEIDLGIVREPFNMKRYNNLPIFDKALDGVPSDCFVTLGNRTFYADPNTKEIRLSELEGLPIILHRRYISMFTALCENLGFLPNIICKNNDIMPLLNWAKAGIGLAVIPYTSAILNSDPSLIQKIIVEPVISSRACVVWGRDVQPTPEVAAFIALLSHTPIDSIR